MTAPDMSRALTFGRCAEEYARWRPTYPAAAVDWLAPEPPAHVADLGAGTGQLTGLLLARGLTVSAVEPDADMLGVLARSFPEADARVASAQELPFPDASLDGVLVATAWHWFPFEDAVAEVGRVLRPGGRLGLVWNLVRPRTPWELELAETDPDHKGLPAAEPAEPSVPFPDGESEAAWFPWEWHVTPEEYAGNLATNSAVMRLGEEDRGARLEAAAAIVRREAARAGSRTVPIHHEAFCLRWTPSAR